MTALGVLSDLNITEARIGDLEPRLIFPEQLQTVLTSLTDFELRFSRLLISERNNDVIELQRPCHPVKLLAAVSGHCPSYGVTA